MSNWLPEKLSFSNYNNDWDSFIEAVYDVFKQDFIYTKPNFRGVRLGLKRHPEYNGKLATFWHMTTVGEIEAERQPDLCRCERMPWPKPVIENSMESFLKVWEEPRGSNLRIHIWFEQEDYLVVLDRRKDFILPWTAFYVEKEHQRKKYIKRWLKYGALT